MSANYDEFETIEDSDIYPEPDEIYYEPEVIHYEPDINDMYIPDPSNEFDTELPHVRLPIQGDEMNSDIEESSYASSTVTDPIESEAESEESATTPATEISDVEVSDNSNKRKRDSTAEIAKLQHENADLRRKFIKVQRDLQTLEARVAGCEATTESAVSEVDNHWAYTKGTTMPLAKAMTEVAKVFAQHFPLKAHDDAEE